MNSMKRSPIENIPIKIQVKVCAPMYRLFRIEALERGMNLGHFLEMILAEYFSANGRKKR